MDNKFKELYDILIDNTTPDNIHKVFTAIFSMSPLITFDLDKVSYNKHKGRYNEVVDAIAISQFKIEPVENLYTKFITPGLKYYIRIVFYKKYVKIPGGIRIRVYKHDPKKQKYDGTRPKLELRVFINELLKYDPNAMINLEKGLFEIV